MSAYLFQHVLMPANSSCPFCKCAFIPTVPLSINAVVSHYSLIPLPSLSCAWSCSASSQQRLFFLQTTLSHLRHPHLLVWVNVLHLLRSTKLLCDSFCRGGQGQKAGAWKENRSISMVLPWLRWKNLLWDCPGLGLLQLQVAESIGKPRLLTHMGPTSEG